MKAIVFNITDRMSHQIMPSVTKAKKQGLNEKKSNLFKISEANIDES
jgi:hypothetical protein